MHKVNVFLLVSVGGDSLNVTGQTHTASMSLRLIPSKRSFAFGHKSAIKQCQKLTNIALLE